MNTEKTQVVWISALVSSIVGIGVVLVFGLASPPEQPQNQTAASRASMQAVNQQTATSASSQIVDVVSEVSPAVVSIVVRKDVPQIERFYQRGPFGIRIPRQQIEGFENQQVGGGSGFFVSEDGLVVTNRHVVSDRDASYSAVTSDGETVELEVVGRDPFLDIAVLRATSATTSFQTLSFGDSDNLQPGQTVIAIGNALGEFQNSVSTGVVSGLSRSIVAGGGMGNFERLDRVIQTDAAINPGNSGGPLLNLAGEVIGVNVAIARGSENISFALPANLVQEVVRSVEENGEIVRPFLGVRYQPVTKQLADERDLPADQGALIIRGRNEQAVTPGSAADDAGLQAGDIITEFDGQTLTESNNLAAVIREYDVGDTVTLTVNRDGEVLTLQATLRQAPMPNSQ